jgi:type IX secretion system PorP/SprF family membrane protein
MWLFSDKGGKIMKRKLIYIYSFLLLVVISTPAKAQQDPMYSQYMWNMLSINPAYAGNRDAMSLTLLARRQWLSVPGAPKTETISLHARTPNQRSGFGINLVHDRISYIGQTWMHLSYSFRIPMKSGTLALGLQGSVNNYTINWSRAFLIDATDNVPLNYGQNLWLPNAGTGIFYSTKKFYAGVSIPHLLINSLDQNQPGIYLLQASANKAVLKRHVFAATGLAIPLSDNVIMKPSTMLKMVEAAPAELDLNLEFLFKEKLWLGGSWRTGDGIVGMIQYQILPTLRAGYSYDYPFTRLGAFTTGSHEILIGWDIPFSKESAVSPRYF